MSIFSFFSKAKISSAFKQIFTHKKLDDLTIEELEEILLLSDMGSEVVGRLLKKFSERKFDKKIADEAIKNFLAEEIAKILKPCEGKIVVDEAHKPYVIVFNGVNGAGKTTTIGKIAANLSKQNKKVLIAACDTFRAAACAQLEVWAQRAGCEIVKPKFEGEDPASVAYTAMDFAKKNGFDVLLIDTAGRLQNKQNLMDELKKINTVIKKIDATAPHENLLILDAITGQNAKMQLEIFNQIVGITGLIITKLDGTAKGGIVVAIAEKFKKPIYAIGVGEKIEDLQEFDAGGFANNLLGV